MNTWTKFMLNISGHHKVTSVDEIRKHLVQDIRKCCFDGGRNIYNWPRPNQLFKNYDYIKDIFIKHEGIQVGYIQGISIHRQDRNARIAHFAVAKNFVGFGFGFYIARHFARIVSRLYNIKTITFAENHPNYEDSGYEGFFIRLGAKKVEGTRSTWIWNVENYRI